MNQATQLHQLEQSISMAEVHNSTIKTSKYTCMNQRNLNAITIAAMHKEDGWGWCGACLPSGGIGQHKWYHKLSKGGSTSRELQGSSWPLTKLDYYNP